MNVFAGVSFVCCVNQITWCCMINVFQNLQHCIGMYFRVSVLIMHTFLICSFQLQVWNRCCDLVSPGWCTLGSHKNNNFPFIYFPSVSQQRPCASVDEACVLMLRVCEFVSCLPVSDRGQRKKKWSDSCDTVRWAGSKVEVLITLKKDPLRLENTERDLGMKPVLFYTLTLWRNLKSHTHTHIHVCSAG